MNDPTPPAGPQPVSLRDVLDALDELNHHTPPQQHTPLGQLYYYTEPTERQAQR